MSISGCLFAAAAGGIGFFISLLSLKADVTGVKPGNGLRLVNKLGCVGECVCQKVGKRSQEFSVILPAQISAYRRPLASCLTWRLCVCVFVYRV